MRRFLTSILLLLMFTIGITTFAQEVTITIEPESVVRGDEFVITAEGLEPNEDYTFELVFVDTGDMIFESDTTSDNDGVALLPLITEQSDELGEYEVSILDRRDVLATATFEIVLEEESSNNNDNNTTPSSANSDISIEIFPTEGVPRDTFNIVIEDLAPASQVLVLVIEEDPNDVVYEREWTADDDGIVRIEIFTTSDTTFGDYSVIIEDDNGDTLGESSFAIVEPAGRNAVVEISPSSAGAGTVFEISISDAKPFDDLTIEILDPESNTVIFETIVRTNVDGEVTAQFESATDLAEADYQITIEDTDGLVGEGTLTIGAAVSPDELAVFVNPEEAVLGGIVTVTAVGLTPNSEADFVISDEDGEVANFTQRTNRRGSASITFTADSDANVGTYTVEVFQDGDSVLDTEFDMAEAPEVVTEPAATPEAPTTTTNTSDITMTIDPLSAPIGGSYNITVNGAEPASTVTFNVIFDGQVVFTSDKEADNSGVAFLSIVTSSTDEQGTYTIEAVTDSEVIASSDFIVGEPGTTTLTNPDASSASVNVSVSPNEGAIGTSHLVQVTGLEPNTDLTVFVTLDGEEQYSTDRTADANGNFEMRLRANTGDETGEYAVAIIVDGETVAETNMTVLAEGSTSSTTLTTPTPDNLPDPIAIELEQGDSETIEGSLTEDEPTFTYEIDLNEGDTLQIAVTADDFDTYLQVFDSSEFEVAYNDDFNGLNSTIPVFVAPYDDTFTIIVTSFDYYVGEAGAEGDFALSIGDVNLNDIDLNQPVEFTLTDDLNTANFQLDLSAGDLISINTYSNLDTYISVLDSSGFEVIYNDDGGAGFDAEIERYQAQADETLTVIVGSLGGNGSVIFSVGAPGGVSLEDGDASIQLGTKGSSDIVTFEGVAGEEVSFFVRADGDFETMFIYVDQEENNLISFTTNNIPSVMPFVVLVPEDGEVRIQIEAQGIGTVTIERQD
jgi:5-hydroxyisourate hydrolase-like protein (transthyretin family)